MTTNAQRIKQIQEAISAQEQLRGLVDDSVIVITIGILQKELDKLLSVAQVSEQQRKMVTVLFLDVVNSTRMIQAMEKRAKRTMVRWMRRKYGALPFSSAL